MKSIHMEDPIQIQTINAKFRATKDELTKYAYLELRFKKKIIIEKNGKTKDKVSAIINLKEYEFPVVQESDKKNVQKIKQDKEKAVRKQVKEIVEQLYLVFKHMTYQEFEKVYTKEGSIEQLYRQLQDGVKKDRVIDKAQFENMSFLELTQSFLEDLKGKKCEFNSFNGGINSVGNYPKAANKFVESLGSHIREKASSTAIVDFAEFSKGLNFQFINLSSDDISNIIRLNADRMKTGITKVEIEKYLEHSGITLLFKKYNTNNRDRTEALADRINKAFCIRLGSSIKIPDLKSGHLLRFADYLAAGMAENKYMNYVCSILDYAKFKISLDTNLIFYMKKQNKVSFAEPDRRMDLSKNEIEKLLVTPWPRYEDWKKAFFFSCESGLRSSDIETLKRSEIVETEEGFIINKLMKKTKKYARVPISDNAMKILEDFGFATKKQDENVFSFQKGIDQMRNKIHDWLKSAGVEKKVTYHSSRHTFVSTLVNSGVDAFLISDLLGHTDTDMIKHYMHIKDIQRFNAIKKLNILGKQ
ncbi:site-specific integrase [Xanthocytophaga agilis]|uniref:Site-specific integrase n=1 Tax=Xanthocytophaga agilis TaxID=3048010 RepID=A0AAE3R3H4_9BACT|nr:site-specific integrase [Xanthocytophaga agilis]MDJ1500679.1 site-specific integrase [Xanthocytophaga agilis]